MGAEKSTLERAGGRIVFRFHARDLHLVLAPGGPTGALQGDAGRQAPGADQGMDVDAQGVGIVTTERLYQLVRQKGPLADRTFEIEFFDPGVQSFAFTFG